MLTHALAPLRERLDALAAGAPERLPLWTRAAARLHPGRRRAPRETPTLDALDRELDRVGIHTLGDALLLRELGVRVGRAHAVAVGLAARGEVALAELQGRVGDAEGLLIAGALPPGELAQLEHRLAALARVVKVSDLFGDEPASEDEDAEALLTPPRRPRAHAVAPGLALAEWFAERARTEPVNLQAKRRALERAHELLLRMGTAEERERFRSLRVEVAAARERLRGLPPSASLDDWGRHLRALSRGETRTLYRELHGMLVHAAEAREPTLYRAARGALEGLLPGPAALRARLEAESVESLARWLRADAGVSPAAAASSSTDEALLELALGLGDGALESLELAAACERYFDVEEGAVEEGGPREAAATPALRRVPYPTATFTVDHAQGMHELGDFILHDPRLLLHDVASGRQLVRAYLAPEPPPPPRRRRTAVRVYVCDASGSMEGPRARFRDAVLLAALNGLRRRGREGGAREPLYYSFFNDFPQDMVRVDSREEATRHMVRLLERSPAQGHTDITLALLMAFEQIRNAQGKDPYLSRATVVLVTDGEDRVDLEAIREARAPLDALAITLSFLSLGRENADLRRLILEQRERGGRAFYHHVSDAEIGLARTGFDAPFRTLLPDALDPGALPTDALPTDALLPHFEALLAVAQARTEIPEPRSRWAFEAAFPAPAAGSAQVPPDTATADEARVAELLDAIREATSLAPPDERARESVVLLEHLLELYALPRDRYLQLVAGPKVAPEVRTALVRLRRVCRPLG